MKFVSLPSIRSTVAQLISNASLAFALATFTGVASSPAWAEANLTPQQLDEEYEQEYLLFTVAHKISDLLWWRKTKDDRSKPAYGTTSFPQYRQKLMDTFSYYSLKEKQEEMDKAFYVEKKYGHLSNSELEVKYKELAERTCWNSLLIAEAGGSKALFGLFNNKLTYCWVLVERSLVEKYHFKKKAIAMQITEGKLQVEPYILAEAHHYLAGLYSAKESDLVRRDRDKTKYHLEQAKKAYGQACDAGVADGCRMYNKMDDHYYRRYYLAQFDEETE
ncbi:hypothetical protein [Glaesserella parasuis]|uniref:Uncharacterized protein n=1 Tax=Glaesserella parasuis TaxID=738 RepID=A0AAJ6DA73_GLAPU|nr:hypothetical protein [Glaesserella parasuis]WGE10302.1 hypothetical protein QBL01_01385 [Glaesserella parasuis]